jgi:SAM-dependent methyltransferase
VSRLASSSNSMELEELQRHWDRFGRDDPFWAILTQEDKRAGRWTPEEFFAHGVKEIAQVVARTEELGIELRRDRALDFGCGAGRLTQALCEHFKECDGVDIAPSMIALAERFNRHAERCRYHLGASGDLRRFPDASFDFAYTVLVLQHMPPGLAKAYLAELLRVLRPGGLLVFQVPSERAETEPVAGTATVGSGPLPDSARRARILPEQVPASVAAGESFEIKVSLQNTGNAGWPATAEPERRLNVALGNHWLKSDGTLVALDDARAPLPYDLGPGQDVDLVITPKAPAEAGDYLLDFDAVQEGVAWFGWHASPTARFPVRVVSGSTTSVATEAPPFPKSPPPPSVPERAPTAPSRLRRAGAAAYRRLRRLLPERAPEKPVAAEWQPVMEMHCVPKAEVVALLTQHGARVLDVERHSLPGFRSYRYWVGR